MLGEDERGKKGQRRGRHKRKEPERAWFERARLYKNEKLEVGGKQARGLERFR